MPTSRSRKTKKKKVQKHEPETASEHFTMQRSLNANALLEDLKLEFVGNMTYLRNTRSESEQESYLKKLLEDQPVKRVYLIGQIKKAITVFQNYDSAKLLGALATNHIFLQHDGNDDALSEIILEYGMSIAASLPEKTEVKHPSSQTLRGLIALLGEIRHLFLKYYISESIIDKTFIKATSPAIANLRFDVIMEALAIRGVGYYDHVEEIFLELFSGHNEFLIKHYGFKASDIVATFHEFERAFAYRLEGPNGMPHPAVLKRFMDWAMHYRVFPPSPTPANVARFKLENPDIFIVDNKIITYDISNVRLYPSLYQVRYYKEEQRKVVEALQMPFGANSAYLEGDFPADLLSATRIWENHFYEITTAMIIFFRWRCLHVIFCSSGKS
jgi:hypothetical protein